MRNVLPFNMMAMSMGLHPRCGIEDTIIDQHGNRKTSVQQIEQCVRVARELGREIASGKEAREIYKIGVQTYKDADETLARGLAPNRKAGQIAAPPRLSPGTRVPRTRTPRGTAPRPSLPGQRGSRSNNIRMEHPCQPSPPHADGRSSPARRHPLRYRLRRVRADLRSAAVGLHVAAGPERGLSAAEARVGAVRHATRFAQRRGRADGRSADLPAVGARRPLGPRAEPDR